MKILHTADWHLDAPMAGHSDETRRQLQRQLAKIPEKIAKLCIAEKCDLMVIAGDLFDGECTRQTVETVKAALASVQIPVIITPGNHDYCRENSPYLTGQWPENVHIFTQPQITALSLPELDCKIYGAGYTAMDCPGLLKDFRAEGPQRWHIGVLHAEAGNASSDYCPVTRHQIQESGLDYLALGHIHKLGSLRAGDAVCAWPGCPMGRGYDELGAKGVAIVTLDGGVSAVFTPLDTPRFYDEEVDAGDDPVAAVASLLPAMHSSDFYRITLTGYAPALDLAGVRAEFPHIANLQLQDETVPETDLWASIGEDSLEGAYFALLKEASLSESENLRRRANLAARISRRILDGQEVKLP